MKFNFGGSPCVHAQLTCTQHCIMIKFLPTIPLVIPLCGQEVLACLDHWLNLVDYMNYLPKQAQNTAYIHGKLAG